MVESSTQVEAAAHTLSKMTNLANKLDGARLEAVSKQYSIDMHVVVFSWPTP